MIIIVPFCIKDCRSALKNIEWSYELDGQLPFDVLLSYDSDVPQKYVDDIDQAARKSFGGVTHFRYAEWTGSPNWPNPQNYAFISMAWEIILKHKRPFLFWEADAIPIRKGWATDIWSDYQACGKPFMGHIVHGAVHPTSQHLNGVAVYPPDLNAYSTAMMIPPLNMAWDIAGATGRVVQNSRHSHLIMNVWEIDEDNKPVRSGGIHPTFPDQLSVDALVDFDAALFHRNKDMTLIDRLRERRAKTKPVAIMKQPVATAIKAEQAPSTPIKKRRAKRRKA